MFYTFAEKSVVEQEGGKSRRTKVGNLVSDLRSGDDKKVASALKGLAVHGDESVIAPLLELLRTTTLSEENEQHLLTLFMNLKDTTVVPELMRGFNDPANAGVQRQLVNLFWNTSLDFSPYLSDFVLFALEGDFLDAFEAITLIEQFETAIPESAILESQLLLKEYFGGTNRSEQKDLILTDMAILLKRFEEDADSDGIEEYFEED